MTKITKKQAIHELWRRGQLSYMLKGKQVDLYNAIEEADLDINVILASRRFGKSFTLFVKAVEKCVSKPHAIIKYLCPKQKMAKTIIKPNMRLILRDCPPDMLPEWKEADKIYLFPNGSEIQIAGTDNGNAENLRGGHADLVLVDEAGYCTELTYAVNSILAPTTDTTNGKIILASTPNYKEPQHEFHTDFIQPIDQINGLVRFTIYDSPMVDDKKIAKIIARYPRGVDDPKFKCEYLCEIQFDAEFMVFGEFDKETEETIVVDYKRPTYYNAYASMDIGFTDLTGVLFGYYDYLNATVVIEDEIIMNGLTLTTDNLANSIKLKEEEIFRCEKTGVITEIDKRVADNNNQILLNDLYRLHGIIFHATAKDNKEARINELKLRMKNRTIIISPKCKNLIYQIKNCKWSNNRKEFKRIKDSPDKKLRGGHADLVDALIYLLRNINIHKDPYPEGYFELQGSNVFKSSRYRSEKDKQLSGLLGKILNISPKK